MDVSLSSLYKFTHHCIHIVYFVERPPVLYEVQSDQSYFTLALKQHLVLVVDKKLKEPVLINVASGDRKTGRVKLATLLLIFTRLMSVMSEYFCYYRFTAQLKISAFKR